MKALVLFFTLISFHAKAQLIEMQDSEWNRYKYEAIDTVGTFVELSFDKNSAIAIKNAHQFRLHKHTINEFDKVFISTSNEIYTCAVAVDPTNELFDIISLNTNVVSNVKLKKNALNRFVITYDGSLVFTYRDNRERPVLFSAHIENRNFHQRVEQNLAQDISCSEKTVLIPGNYNIDIDVLPPYMVVTEISFGRTTEIQLPQLGVVDFENIAHGSGMKLYIERQGDFIEVGKFNYKEHCQNGRINLRPGAYKIVQSVDGVVLPEFYFLIKSNLITHLSGKKSDPNTPFLPTEGEFLFTP